MVNIIIPKRELNYGITTGIGVILIPFKVIRADILPIDHRRAATDILMMVARQDQELTKIDKAVILPVMAKETMIHTAVINLDGRLYERQIIAYFASNFKVIYKILVKKYSKGLYAKEKCIICILEYFL